MTTVTVVPIYNTPAVIVIFLLLAVLSYFLGCFNGAILVSCATLGDDIRKHGSGNAGLTNFYRTFGAKYAGLVIVLDMLKAALAVSVGALVMRYFGVPDWIPFTKYFAALFCIVGHMFPFMFSFKGGKGILCSATLLLLLDWRIALVGWGLFLVMWLATRYVSLGSLSAAVSFPITTYLIYHDIPVLMLSLCIAALVILAHRTNIVRLLHGTESKFRWHLSAPKENEP